VWRTLETSEAVAGRQPTEGCLRSDREYAPGHRRLTSRVQNRLKPTQAQTVITAAILRQLSTVMVRGQARSLGHRRARHPQTSCGGGSGRNQSWGPADAFLSWVAASLPRIENPCPWS